MVSMWILTGLIMLAIVSIITVFVAVSVFLVIIFNPKRPFNWSRLLFNQNCFNYA